LPFAFIRTAEHWHLFAMSSWPGPPRLGPHPRPIPAAVTAVALAALVVYYNCIYHANIHTQRGCNQPPKFPDPREPPEQPKIQTQTQTETETLERAKPEVLVSEDVWFLGCGWLAGWLAGLF